MYTTLRSLSGWLLLLLCLFPALANSQQTGATLSGVITSSKGEQLPGVSVEARTADGQRKGTASLVNGSYTLANLPAGVPLQITFTFLGFQPLVVKDKVLSNGSNTFSVQLQEGDQKLNELV